MARYTFPPELGSTLSEIDTRYPYVHFDIIKFRNRTFVTDNSNASSSVAQIADNVSINATTSDTIHRLDSVYLPLPNDIQNNYSLSWEMSDLRGTKALVDLFSADGLSGAASSLYNNVPGLLFDKLAKVATAQTPNPKKQALFNGIEPRTFSFNWMFAPQSLREAEQIDRIVGVLTRHSLPSLETENSAFFQFPSEFIIEYHNVVGFPKSSTCVCTGVNINKSPNSVQLLQSGHTVQTQLSMTFLETELLRKQKPGL